MTKQKPIEIINPPNMLKVRLGGAIPALDQKAIERAEAALSQLSWQFNDWIQEELAHLQEAWAEYEAQGETQQTRVGLHRRSHDLKGLAPTYGFPLVGRVCSSLCKLTGDDHADVHAPAALLKAHVDTVRALIAGDIRDAAHPVGVTLAAELEERARVLIDQAA
jgi:HPt (histidine-containing phosphotransfer) domain-containing protein